MKTCRTCGEVKPLDEFSVANKKTGTRRNDCKTCKSAATMANPNRLATKRRYREQPRVKNRQSAYKVEWQNLRRANENSVPHEPYSSVEIFTRWGGRCCYCDGQADALDHVTPISNKGADAAWNLVPACRSCNASKGRKSLANWALTF